MDLFTYEPIDLGGPAFRLLRVQRGQGTVIQCELFQAWLHRGDDAISYEALSYTWGSTYRTDSIEVNGKKLYITTNLYLALCHLRSPDEDRILWVDAVCIDQSNLRERGHQVQQMGETYKQAQRVIFWLGQATYETNVVMECLYELQQESKKHACHAWMRSDERWRDLWETVQDDLRGKHAGLDTLLPAGLQTLLDRPWFRRVWILQEVANARAALACCGTRSVQARIFALAPRLKSVTPSPHCQSVLDIMPGASRKDSWWGESRDLCTLLVKFSASEAHDPRDMVYALLGMSSDAHDSDRLRPDYGKSEKEVVHSVISLLYSRGVSGMDTKSRGVRSFLEQFRPRDDVSVPSLSSDWSPEGLSWAINQKREVDTQHLLNEACHPQSGDSQGRTPLALAILGGQVDVAKLLIDRGSDLDAKGVTGRTPLSWAAGEGREGVVKILLQWGSDVNAKDSTGRTPLSWAAEKRNFEAANLLLQRGAEVDSKDHSGRTPLSWAAEKGGLARPLLQRGAEVDSKDSGGRTPLSWAVEKGNSAITYLLLERGAQVNSKDSSGRTPLSWAVEKSQDARKRRHRWERHSNKRQKPITELLLDSGAQVNLMDCDGRTPLFWAVKEKKKGTIRPLLRKGARIASDDSSVSWDTNDSETDQVYRRALVIVEAYHRGESLDTIIEEWNQADMKSPNGKTVCH